MKKFLKKVSLFTICAVCVNVLGLLSLFENNDTKAYAETTTSSVSKQKNIVNESEINAMNKEVTNGLIKVWCSAKTSNSITLEWDKVDNESGPIVYEIYGKKRRIARTKDITKYVVSSLEPNQPYEFHIIAKNSLGQIVASSDSFSEETMIEKKPDGTDNNGGEIIKPETLINIENQDFAKEISGNAEISGYFLSNNRNPVNAKVFIDGVDKTGQVQDFCVGTERSDLGLQYPSYSNVANSGFSFKFDTYNLSNGEHTLKLMFHDTSREYKFKVSNIQG